MTQTQYSLISTPYSKILILLCAASLAACASKVRLDDLPPVVDRSGSMHTGHSGTYSGVLSSGQLGSSSTSTSGLGTISGTAGAQAVDANTLQTLYGANTSGITGNSGIAGASANNTIRTVQANDNSNNNRAGNSGSSASNAALLSKRSVYFDYDSFEVREEFKAILQAHARQLSANRGTSVALEGHTDERGGAEYNLALGQKRANAVQQTLRALGVSASQIEAVSYGKEKPKSMGTSEAGFAENRRVDIQYK
jgi:peptidoglycan-associated lipoprotein